MSYFAYRLGGLSFWLGRAQFFLSLEIRHGDAGDAEKVGHVAPRRTLLDAAELSLSQRDDDADRL
jgi:hypothetical protein